MTTASGYTTHDDTHIHDEEVQPAPGIGEVGLEAVRHPLQQHLHDEDVGEGFIGVLQNDFNRSSPLKVNVLKCLGERQQKGPVRGGEGGGGRH